VPREKQLEKKSIDLPITLGLKETEYFNDGVKMERALYQEIDERGGRSVAAPGKISTGCPKRKKEVYAILRRWRKRRKWLKRKCDAEGPRKSDSLLRHEGLIEVDRGTRDLAQKSAEEQARGPGREKRIEVKRHESGLRKEKRMGPGQVEKKKREKAGNQIGEKTT